MLEIGNGGMTETEYKTHMSLWAMLAAPLLAGNDLRQMNAETLAILTNREVIAVDQDKLENKAARRGSQAIRRSGPDNSPGGDMAIAFFNRAKDEAKISVKWADVGAPAKRKARDLWLHQSVDVSAPEYTATVPGHGVLMLRINAK